MTTKCYSAEDFLNGKAKPQFKVKNGYLVGGKLPKELEGHKVAVIQFDQLQRLILQSMYVY